MNKNTINAKADVARVEASGHVIANFAWQHLKAATIFRDRVASLEDEHINEPFGAFFEEIRSYASACLMSSAASLEALINEFFIAHDGKLRACIKDFEKDFWGNKGIEKKPILEKYQLALEMLGVDRLDEQSYQFQDASALIKLRNALVHHKPTWDPDRKRKVELIEILDGRFPISPFPDENADFVSMKCMGAGCCRWAVAATLSFMRKFHEQVNLDSNKMEGFWALDK